MTEQKQLNRIFFSKLKLKKKKKKIKKCPLHLIELVACWKLVTRSLMNCRVVESRHVYAYVPENHDGKCTSLMSIVVTGALTPSLHPPRVRPLSKLIACWRLPSKSSNFDFRYPRFHRFIIIFSPCLHWAGESSCETSLFNKLGFSKKLF